MRLRELLYPQLRRFDPLDRPEALRRAREAPFDVIELVGIAFGLVVTTAITAQGADSWALLERIASIFANFLVAVPMLGVLVGPFLVRHVRRGLERQLDTRVGEAGR